MLALLIRAEWTEAGTVKTETMKVEQVDIKEGKDFGGGFRQMSADEIKIEQIDLKPHQSYVSPEIKARAQFKYYNNTFVYISIRP